MSGNEAASEQGKNPIKMSSSEVEENSTEATMGEDDTSAVSGAQYDNQAGNDDTVEVATKNSSNEADLASENDENDAQRSQKGDYGAEETNLDEEDADFDENDGFGIEDLDEAVHKLKRHRRKAPVPKAAPTERKRRPKVAPRTGDEISQKKPESRTRRARKDTFEPAEEFEENIDPTVAERRALEARIDAALQPSSKRHKKLSGDDLEALQDDAIARLRDEMRAAAIRDVESISQGEPALHKVRLLPEVVKILQRGSLADAILDGSLLTSVRIWLEPLPDLSLPSFEIQRVLFTALTHLPIKTIHLRESGLGRIVLFYQKSKRPQPVIKRMAQKLIGDWTRPIIGRSDNYRDKRVSTASFDPLSSSLHSSSRASDASKSSYEEAAARRNRAAVPSASGVSYHVAPVSSQSESSLTSQGSASKDFQLRRIKTKLMATGRSGRKKSQVSVEGKDLN